MPSYIDSFELTGEGVRKCVVWEYKLFLEVKILKIEPDHQGKGIGSALLRKLQERGKKIVLYPVSDDFRQTDLERFYLRLGFKPDFASPDWWEWEP